jgi:hypothetical protein
MYLGLTVVASLLHLHLMHHIFLCLVHIWSYVIDHVESEHEEPTEQAPDEEFTNLALNKGKPRYI